MTEQLKKYLRSPSYPSMPLEHAVNAVAKIEKVYRTSRVDRREAAKLLGYSSLSGPAAKALAALASYGLLERAGKGEARVTERAKTILYADDEERHDGLRDAALEPPLFRELRERFEAAIDDGVPLPESGVIRHLERENFNPSAVRPAAQAFLKTIEFLASSGASKSHGIEPQDDVKSLNAGSGSEPATYEGAQVGDYIQWESEGVLRLSEPLRVRAIHDDGEWVFVEGHEVGIPMNQVIVEEREAAPPPAPPTLPLDVGAEARQTGEHEQLEYKLSDTTRVRLSVTGEMGTKELGRLIRLLETQCDILKDEEEEK
ncbi:MAG: hypothetical protein J4F40_10880 [Alphaproteobacteria bacterium]|nr:hypothetical protein [Alphaproteobacteria bacterium]